MNKFLVLLILLLMPLQVTAKETTRHLFYEKDYQKYWCEQNNGILEYHLPDKARVDCVTDTHAIEFDFATKWAESIGQALYYANRSGKLPGVVLISEKGEKDNRYIKRINTIAEQFNITVWVITPKDICP